MSKIRWYYGKIRANNWKIADDLKNSSVVQRPRSKMGLWIEIFNILLTILNLILNLINQLNRRNFFHVSKWRNRSENFLASSRLNSQWTGGAASAPPRLFPANYSFFLFRIPLAPRVVILAAPRDYFRFDCLPQVPARREFQLMSAGGKTVNT